MIAVVDKPEESVAVVSDGGQWPRKPLMRGWLHLGFAPALLIAGLVLTALAPTLPGRIGCAVWTLSGVQLFGTSAAYHRGNWNEPTMAVFRRLDHSNIFVFIAGTYTPLTLTLLDGGSRWVLLGLIWGIAAFGIVFRICWVGAPRWLYTLLYVAMGWAALGWLGEFWTAGGPAVVLLMCACGLVYSLGRWPTAPVARVSTPASSDSTRSSTPAPSRLRSVTGSQLDWRCSEPERHAIPVVAAPARA